MNTKTILAGFAGGVFAFFAGWLIFGILLMDFMMGHTTMYDGLMKDPPDFVFIIISNLAYGLFLAYVFDKWADARTLASGFTKGLIISLFITVYFDASMYAFYNLFDMTALLTDVVMGSIFGGLIGAVVGLVLGSGKKG
ncbi:MAG TPA: hypothetical protein PKC24_12020 [Cyclobacteriaceae bacterium]|nr:hypothetical protein [Cyclobacteriaceae bacterium]